MSILHQLTTEQKGQKQWYGRTTMWEQRFIAKFNSDQQLITEGLKSHFTNTLLNKLSKIFFQTINSFGVSVIDQTIDLTVHLDRNEVSKKDAKKSGMFWHRDAMSTDENAEVADYTMIVLLSHESGWTGGNVRLQYGGELTEKMQWENSNAPEVIIEPHYNQALIFHNANSAHMVEPIEPLSGRVNRDVLILTAKLC